jgi:hypothetical protein
MKQLTKHIMRVRFYSNPAFPMEIDAQATVDCADINESRALGRRIAEWMARGVGYRVESETMELERK